MGIAPEQLHWDGKEVRYRSLDYGDLNEIEIPSADSITIRERLKAGKLWGKPFDAEINNRPKIPHTLDADAIKKDMAGYCDFQFIQYLDTGGPANFDLPFRKMQIDGNYAMTENAIKKTVKKYREELKLGYVQERDPSLMPIFREHKQGAIPKSRKDKKKKEEGGEYQCRTISDFSAKGRDQIAINKVLGECGKLELPQGERVHRIILEAYDYCVENGLDPKGLRGVKIDIKAAFRTLCTNPADYWALCFRIMGKSAFHKRWPFGLTASVYFFLRLPLLIITYLVTKTDFEARGTKAAMYFDDLITIAHESRMEWSVKVVMDLFKRWKIPRQEEKFLEDNPNGAKGCVELTILGLLYHLANLTVGIPKPRVSEVVEEMEAFMKTDRRKLKEWESTIGVINWAATAVPQLRMYLTSSWRMIKTIKREKERKGHNKKWKIDTNPNVRISDDTRHDWKEIAYQLKHWNGTQKILKTEWEECKEEGYSIEKDDISPASDASGSIGWGAVCMDGYAWGLWSKEEKDLKIHIKEGLGLYALICIFGAELCRRKIKLTLRCDNQSVTSALDKGRAKDKDLAIVMRMIVTAMITAGTLVKFWKTGAKREVRVKYIRSKQNKLADALSRGELSEFHDITNKIPSFTNTQKKMNEQDEARWQSAVRKITGNTALRQTPKKLHRPE
jgi:hypothetical protein